jgi:hypothetical protein
MYHAHARGQFIDWRYVAVLLRNTIIVVVVAALAMRVLSLSLSRGDRVHRATIEGWKIEGFRGLK